jgi:hypothetical protein
MEDEYNENPDKTEKPPLKLELGDIVELIAPTHSDFHEQTFYIQYIDERKIVLVNVSTFELETLLFDEEGFITDESITQITLLSRSHEKGYARQKKLLPSQWLDIHFGGEVPEIITGLITNLEEDMIEMKTYPENEVIYIDFEYKGLPEDIPIEKIVLREAPRSVKIAEMSAQISSPDEAPPSEEASIEYTDTGESIITLPEGISHDENIQEVLHSLYINANELFEEDLEEIYQVVEIPESEKRYGLDVQVNDLTDELLSTIPNSKRTLTVMSRIQLLVERFKELRSLYSTMDSNGNVAGKKIYGELYKPLVDRITQLDTKLKWVVPVVAQNKKLYLDSDESNSILKDTDEIKRQSEMLEDFYKNKVVGDENRYSLLYSRMAEPMTPYTLTGLTNPESLLLFQKEVKTELEAIVNTADDFYSTVITKEGKTTDTNKFRYLVQRYNLGISKISRQEQKQGVKVSIREPLIPNDKIALKSLLFLPETVVKYSHIDLPATNILVRSQLSQESLLFFRLFKQKKELNRYVVERFDKELDYENEKDKEVPSFLSKITEYVIDESLESENNKLDSLLNVIVPKIRSLIRILRPSIEHKFSFLSVVQTLEPFMIYTENITYGQYNEIRYFIKEKIGEFKKKYSENSEMFQKYRNHDFHLSPVLSSLQKTFIEKQEIDDLFREHYREALSADKPNLEHLSSSEILENMTHIDAKQLYSHLLNYMLLSLITPDKLMDALEKPLLEDMGKADKVKTLDCTRRYLAKKYTSRNALLKDNAVENLYYDPEYDDTPYSIIKKYDEDRKKLLPEKFQSFLEENLVQKHDCSRLMAPELAETLILGKKKIRDGEYALLELKPELPSLIREEDLSEKEKKEIEIEEGVRTRYEYYRRIKDHWERDDSIDENAFYDTNTLFCNVDMKCMKSPVLKTCDTLDQNEWRLKRQETRKTLDEFDRRFAVSVDEMRKTLETEISQSIRRIKKNRILEESLLYKYNLIAYEIGKYANNTDDLIESPYFRLKQLILSQDDFAKKQKDLCLFVDQFCREPMSDEHGENPHWLYCKETNVPLLEQSIYRLAQAFMGGEDYMYVLDRLCRDIGAEEGEFWVDKHCGNVLRRIDYAEEDGYDDSGYKITTNDILEKDLGTVAAESLLTHQEKRKERRVFEDEVSQMIYGIFYTICQQTDLPTESIEDFVMRMSKELINGKDVIMSEKSYAKRAEKAKAPPAPYEIYKKQMIITIVSAVLFVAIQTVVPSFKVRKTFPGCVRSFDGYPLQGGVEDTAGLKYIACVVKKMEGEPWSSLNKITAVSLEGRIRKILEDFLLKNNEIADLYLKKREYMVLHPEETVPKEHQISKWTSFLPPIVEYSVSNRLSGTGTDFDKETLELLKKGHIDQLKHIAVYQSKIIYHGYGVIEKINEIVRSKAVLLKTMSHIPFLENACCNDREHSTQPLTYFSSMDPSIPPLVLRIAHFSKVLNQIKTVSTAPYLFHKENTRIERPVLPSGTVEENMYRAFIDYCHLDTDVPIPEDLQVLMREKPDGYPKKASLSDKIEFLKKSGKRFSTNDFENLMEIVHRRNIVIVEEPISAQPLLMLKDAIENLEMKNSTIIEEPIRKHLLDVIEHFRPNVMISENDTIDTPFHKATIRLKNSLAKSKDLMHTQIMKFLRKQDNIQKKEYNQIQEFLLKIQDWESDRSVIQSGNTYDDVLYTNLQFMKNSVDSMIREIPHKLLNNTIFNVVPKHWNISAEHSADIQKVVNSYNQVFQPFRSNPIIARFLKNITLWSTDVHLFLQHIPIPTPIGKEGVLYSSLFDKKTLYLLFSYVWYSILYEFTRMTEDRDLLQLDTEENKQTRRKRIEEMKDAAVLTDSEVRLGARQDLEEQQESLLEVNIVAGNVVDLKKNVCSLLVAMLNLQMKTKKAIDLSYGKISRKTNKTKQQEKKEFTDFFENMEKDERNIEKSLKKFKMGRWNLGMQRGVFEYDKEMYDREREANMARLFNEESDVLDTERLHPELESYDVEQLAEDAERENEQMYDREGEDITGLGEEYLDGAYYEEDVDRDFGYDD